MRLTISSNNAFSGINQSATSQSSYQAFQANLIKSRMVRLHEKVAYGTLPYFAADYYCSRGPKASFAIRKTACSCDAHFKKGMLYFFFYKRRQSFLSSLSGLAMHLAGYSTNPDNCEISRDTRTNCPPDCDTRILRKCERLFGYNRSNQMSINGALPHQIAYVPTIPEKYCFSSTSKPKGRYDRRRWAVLDEL